MSAGAGGTDGFGGEDPVAVRDRILPSGHLRLGRLGT